MRISAILAGCAVLLAGCSAQAQGNGWPLSNGDDRETPLHFGLYVTPDPENNPIDPPERFTGYHAATDFEIFAEEEKARVPVFAVCTGTITFSGFAEGHGGLVTQFCTTNDGSDITVLYGHLALDSLVKTGKAVKIGAKIGVLGTAHSKDTDGSRKHLHLGVLKGHVSEVRGYVQHENELELFIDPQTVLPLS